MQYKARKLIFKIDCRRNFWIKNFTVGLHTTFFVIILYLYFKCFSIGGIYKFVSRLRRYKVICPFECIQTLQSIHLFSSLVCTHRRMMYVCICVNVLRALPYISPCSIKLTLVKACQRIYKACCSIKKW